MHPPALNTKITTSRMTETREFYVTCLGMRVVEEWRQEEDVGCILALAGKGRQALLEIYEGSGADGFAELGFQASGGSFILTGGASRPGKHGPAGPNRWYWRQGRFRGAG